MSTTVQTRGEVGGGVAAHLRCPFCGHLSRSHAHQLSHVAASHPAKLGGVPVGRLGNILLYQSSAQLFHCFDCFFTSREFTKLYKHVVAKHCVDRRDGGGGGEEKEGAQETIKEEEEEKEVGALKSEEKHEEDGTSQTVESESGSYCCLMCSWKGKLKSLGVAHVMQEHDIPKTYAAQAVKRCAATPKRSRRSEPEEEEEAGLSGEMLKEEVEATAKVIRFTAGRFVCLICGWKSKLKGFAISHVVGCHEVERPYACKDCRRSFFLPSRLQQHVGAAHRPGRYACPFCSFRSRYLGGFRRHCSRCNVREGRQEDQHEEEKRAARKRRAVGVIKEEEEG
ncbi:zinc finger protein 639-like [Brachionichthys hirsutus]|uniref:zinc finger protein 639-like n=1 Tax=Brachionichthys hirsutus TaxID=412623 RepID=UPI0036048819